jgi:hypothetical protein
MFCSGQASSMGAQPQTTVSAQKLTSHLDNFDFNQWLTELEESVASELSLMLTKECFNI